MNDEDRVPIRGLPTGVPGLDLTLNGGLPEYSFNVIAGAPGAGKTTRNSAHSKELRSYEITSKELVVGGGLKSNHGVFSGVTTPAVTKVGNSPAN